jgi:hypothetical protein
MTVNVPQPLAEGGQATFPVYQAKALASQPSWRNGDYVDRRFQTNVRMLLQFGPLEAHLQTSEGTK